MFSRRAFLSVIGGSIVMPNLSLAQTTGQKVALYANVGPELIHYDVDVAGAELIKRETMTVTGGIQYAWPHASRRYLYVASSNSAPNYVREPKTDHFVTAFAIDPKSGALTKHGEPIRLPQRPIHLSTDIPSDNILVAFPNPSAVRVYRINKDATLGEEVKQPGSIRRARGRQCEETSESQRPIISSRHLRSTRRRRHLRPSGPHDAR